MCPAAPPAFGATEEGLCAPRVARAELGRRERLGGGVRRTGGRGAPEPRSRAPWSAHRGGTAASNRFVDRARSVLPAERSGRPWRRAGAARSPARPRSGLSPQRSPRSLQHRPGDSSWPRLGSASAGDRAAPGLRARSHRDSPRRPRQPLHPGGDPQSAAPGPGRSGGRRLPCRGLPLLPERRRRGRAGPGPSHRRGPGLGLQSPRPGGSNGGERGRRGPAYGGPRLQRGVLGLVCAGRTECAAPLSCKRPPHLRAADLGESNPEARGCPRQPLAPAVPRTSLESVRLSFRRGWGGEGREGAEEQQGSRRKEPGSCSLPSLLPRAPPPPKEKSQLGREGRREGGRGDPGSRLQTRFCSGRLQLSDKRG